MPVRSFSKIGAVLMLLGCRRAPPVLRVAAAADLALAFRDIGAAYQKQYGQPVVFSFGSTGLLAKQISQGAPFDLFAAANSSFADDVIRDGACLADSKALYARGRIVLWARSGAPNSVRELADPRFVKIAIANPEHAPYGRAAMEALQQAGVWEAVRPRLVYGENVQQTLQFAETGNAEVAVVALSLAIVSGGEYLEVPAELHRPIDQALVVCSRQPDAAAAARRFSGFVNGESGRAIMRRYGFLLPGEGLAQPRR
jgi:molybdate transport system substrate-binding protein